MKTILDSFPAYVAVLCPERVRPMCAKPGHAGFWRLPEWVSTLDEADMYLQRLYGVRRPSDAERDAAWCGASFGWNAPSACPLWWTMKIEQEKRKATK